MFHTSLRNADARSGRLAWVCAAAIILLGAGLRAWNLHATGFNSDEIAELNLSRKPLADIALDRDDDRFPPLHRTVMAMWNRAWQSDAAARWLSVACSVIAMGVVWRAGAEILGERTAVWPALFVSVSPFDVYLARDSRAYAMYILWSAVMFWAALRLLRRGSWGNWALLIASTSLAVYTHYYAAPLGATLWCVVLFVAVRRDGWRRPIAAAAIATALLAPAPILLWRALADLPDEKLVAWFDLEALGFGYFSLVTGFGVGPSIKELRSIPAAEGIRQFAPWIALVGFAYAVLGWHALRSLKPDVLVVLLLPLLALVPALGVAGNIGEFGFVIRYVCWMVVPSALLLGAGATRWRESVLARAAVVALLCVNLVGLYHRYFDPRYAEEDYRAVAARLDELDPQRRPVLVASNYMGAALQYYLADSRPLGSFPIFAQHQDERERTIQEFVERHQGGEQFWIVSQWLPVDDVRRATRDAALARFQAKLAAELNQTEIYAAVVPE